MDPLNSVREMRQTGDGDVSAARSALTNEMAGARRVRPRRRMRAGIVVAVGCLTVGGVVAGALTSTAQLTGTVKPGDVEEVSAASLLKNAALHVGAYDFPVKPGQYIATTMVNSTLDYVHAGGKSDLASDANHIAKGAVAAVKSQYTQTVYQPANPAQPLTTAQTEIHPVAYYGDQAVARAAATPALYGSIGSFVHTGAGSRDNWAAGFSGPAAPLPFTDYPTDPAKFRTAWATANNTTDSAVVAASKAGIAGRRMSTSMSMMASLLSDTELMAAPGEYRAVFLSALALSGDVKVVESHGDVSVFETSSATDTFRVTINVAKGTITKSEWLEKQFLGAGKPAAPVGTAAFMPPGTPRESSTVSQKVVDQKPADTK